MAFHSDFIQATCAGSPREMGLAQGRRMADQIHVLRTTLTQFEAFRLLQPRWLPYGIFRWLSEQKARQLLSKIAPTDSHPMGQRLAGIAEGARISLPAIHLFNAFEPLLSSVAGCTACPGACSAVAVRGRRSATDGLMMARNFDYLPLVQPSYLIRDCRPDGKMRTLEFTTAPMAGAIDGMNEAGLCVIYNYAYASDEPKAPAMPISMVIAEVLQNCATVDEAARWIGSKPRWGGGLLMLGETSGDLASLELSNSRSFLRRPAPGEDVLFHSNAFSSATMHEVEIPRAAVFDGRAPSPLRGQRVHESAERRDRRFVDLLSRTEVLDLAGLSAIMADHGPNGVPGEYSPCVHSDYWNTTACLQFMPKERRMRVSFSSACEAKFEDVSF